jgi:hypothetical protein
MMLACAAVTWGDEITLKNGDRISGKILNSDDKTITLKTEFLGEVKVSREAVTAIKTDAPVNVTLKDGQKVTANVETVDGTLRVAPATGAPVTTPIADVGAFRDDAAQHAWEREQERLIHPKLDDFWSGFLSMGLASASGNSSTTTFSSAANAQRIAGRNKMVVSFVQIYATQSSTLPYGTTANKISGGFRIDRDVNKKKNFFVYGVNGYDYDQFLDLNLRIVLGGGLGYHAFKSEKGFLDITAGGQWNRETYDVTPILGPYTTETRNSGELAVGEEAGYNPYKRLKLWERFSFYPNMTDTGEFRYNFDTTASVPILKWLEWNIGFSSSYQSNPPNGKVGRDTILTTGVRATFDQTKR